MNSTDYVVIAAIILSAVVGAARGFLREAIAVAAWLIGLLIAWHFSDLLAPHLGGLLAASEVRPWAARIIIVLLVLLFGAALWAVPAPSASGAVTGIGAGCCGPLACGAACACASSARLMV